MNRSLELMRRELSNPRKLAIIAVLLSAAMLLWGRLLLKQVPRTATAEPGAVEVVAVSEPAGSPAEAAPLPVVYVDLPEHLPRDLFSFGAEGGGWATKINSGPMQEKLVPKRSDEHLRSAAVRKAAEQLELQSVVTGEQPRAVINGRLFAPGDVCDGFTLIEVARRHVLLEQNGVIVRLSM